MPSTAATVAERLAASGGRGTQSVCVGRGRAGENGGDVHRSRPSPRRCSTPSSPVQQLARLLADAGHECYLVGGSVRDALPRPHCATASDRRRPHDRRPPRRRRADRAAVGRPRLAAGPALRHRRLPQATACRSRSRRSAPRSTAPRAASPRSSYSDDIETDLSRRDFTVNAMALAPARARCSSIRSAAPADLAARRLRTPLAPEVSFLDDPLRMLRAARFIARVRARARARARRGGRSSCGTGSRSSSAERIRDELSKLLLVDDPSAGPVVPRRDRPRPTSSCPSSTRCGSSRTRSTRTRTCSRTRSRSCATRGPSCVVRLAALLHDVGQAEDAVVRAAAA